MKSLIRILFIGVAFLCLSLNDTNAQSSTQANQSKMFDVYETYAGKDGFTTVYITPKMFELFANMQLEDEEAQEVVSIVKNLKGIRILVYDNEDETEDDDGNTLTVRKNLYDPTTLYNEFTNLVPRDFYEDLMVIKDDQTNVKFMVHETSPGTINELLMLVGDPDSFVFISLAGIINLKDISKLGNSVDIDGLEHLNKLETK